MKTSRKLFDPKASGAATVAGLAAELRANLAEAQAALPVAEGEVERLANAKRTALLEGDEKALERVKRELEKAEDERERCQLRIEDWADQLAAAEAAERRAQLDAIERRGLDAKHEGNRVITKDYARLADELATCMARLQECMATVAECNAALAAAGDPRQIGDIDREARPSAYNGFLPPPIIDALRLPALDNGEAVSGR